MFALYWDESDENDSSSMKLRRSLYDTYEDALAQAEHDLACSRCRMDKDGAVNLKFKPTGKEPLDPKQKCRDCNGTKICPARNVLYIEDVDDSDLGEFAHAAKRALTSGGPAPDFIHGQRVWERDA